jgi:phospholipid/cholesterol/gamma-HCH transport system substrate-binding protein
MPTAQKVGWAKLRVGVMAIGAMAILAALIFLLTGDTKIFTKEDLLYTYMNDASSITTGAPVRLNGILAGKVKQVELTGDTRPGRIIKMTLQVDHDKLQQIPVDSQAAIAAENVLGTKFINIKKGTKPITIQPNAELRALETTDFDDLMQSGYSLLAQLQGILKRVDAIVSLVEVGKGSIGKLLVDEELYNKVIAIVDEGGKITHALTTDRGTIGKLIYNDEIYQDLRKSLGRVDGMLAELQEGRGTAGKLLKDEALYNDTQRTIVEARKVIEDVNAGKGTIGKLLKSDEVHAQLLASMQKIDTTIDKVNSGQGTIGQLLVNPQLYDNLNGATRELHELFKDFRQNPKKFLRVKISLF